jgi:hypothetical protein
LFFCISSFSVFYLFCKARHAFTSLPCPLPFSNNGRSLPIFVNIISLVGICTYIKSCYCCGHPEYDIV